MEKMIDRPAAIRPGPVLAYLTSQYPATSHTFIRREVAAMREAGLALETYSVRPPAEAELADEVERREHESTYTLLRQGVGTFLAAHLVTLFRRPLGYLKTGWLALSHRPPGIKSLALAFAHFAEAILLARQLERRQVTHLHNHFANSAATVGMLATRLLGIHWSFTLHGISETDYPAGLMLGRKVEAADLVICVSWFGRAQAMRVVAPGHWPKFEVVRCGLDLDAVARVVTAKPGNGTIICVGRLSPEKGHAGLFAAFAELRPRFPAARLTLVGDGPARTDLESLARTLGIDDAVRFAGRQSEAATLAEIGRSDILVLPSLMEGLPIVLMEAMALGVPAVASRIAGIPELITENVEGLLFTPANWEELGERLSALLGDPALGETLAVRARAKIAAEFDIDRSAARLAALFAPLAGRAERGVT